MPKQKAQIIIMPCRKAPKAQQIAVTDMREKPVNFFNGTPQALTLAPAITLLTWVPLQKFPSLFNLQFLAQTMYPL